MALRKFFVVITFADTHETQLDKIEQTALIVFQLRTNVEVTPLDVVVRDEKRGRRLFRPMSVLVPASSFDDDLALARTIEIGIQAGLQGGGIVSSDVNVWIGKDVEKKVTP